MGTLASRSPAVRGVDRFLLAGCLVILGITILYPTLRLVAAALMAWNWNALLHRPGAAATTNTLIISLASVLTAGVTGTAVAIAVTQFRFPGRQTLAALAYLPFTLPPLVGVLSFYYLIGRDGLLPRFLHQVWGYDAAVPGVAAILIIHTYSFFVFFYAMAAPALENLDRAQVEAARTLGAGPVRAFFHVTLPLLRPALVGAALLTFMSSGASFSAPYFFGEDFPMLSVAIYNARGEYDNSAALTLTLALAGVSLLGLALFRGRAHPAAGASKGAPAPLKRRGTRWAAGVAAWACILLLLVPHFNILWLSLINYREWRTELLPTAFTLDNYRSIFAQPANLRPIWNSVWMSGTACGAVLAVSLPAGYLIGRRRPGSRWVNGLAMVPWALPGTVIAINLIVAFNDPWMPVYNTVWMLPLAYFVRNVPLLTRVAGAAIEPFDATLLEAGQTLGAGRLFCFSRIVLPLIGPAIAAGLALVFATCLGEFVASILLYLPSNVPIAIKINMDWRTSAGVAFAYSVLLMVLVAATFGLSRRFKSRVL
ncbi:MAG: iron ABC transporter permease [Candidatus Hydrogenedentes bacterium]|nr:iron ABC transporter permease [Candidatus Hydrogenedentota bacterium]